MSNPTPSTYSVEPEPGRRGRRHIIVACLVAVVLLAGAGVAVAATAGGSHHRAAPSTTATPAATSTTDSSGPTCRQYLDADTGGYDLGEPTNVWAGHMLADLIGKDGIAMQLDGLTQMGFALDLREACLDPSVFNTSARVIGGSVYRANKTKYTEHR